MEERDFSNDTLLRDLAEVFKGLSKKEVIAILYRLNVYLMEWTLVYLLPERLRLKYFEAAIQMFFCLQRHGQLKDTAFDDDVILYMQECLEYIKDMNR